MKRIVFMLVLFFSTPIANGQFITFEQALNHLYFGVDIFKARDTMVDSFMKIQSLHHNDVVIMQSSLNLNLQLHTDKQVWSSRYVFTFTESPLEELKIDSGFIEVKVAEVNNIKQILSLNWQVQFNSLKDATKYFERLEDIFAKVNAKKKKGRDKSLGRIKIAEFATGNAGGKHPITIFFYLEKSRQLGKYQISLLL